MMQKADWHGVLPAITTPFTEDDTVDERFLSEHIEWLVDNGCRGIVALGSLGEGATLSMAEKVRILEVCRGALGSRAPLVAGVSGLATSECVGLARAAEAAGCDGLMVLPPYVYRGDWLETRSHFSAVIGATSLSCMLYNNPIAYGTDLSAAEVDELVALHDNVHALKDSSGDVRRLTALRAQLGDGLRLFAGLDDMVMEAVLMGADGWIAGLVNAFPAESVQLFDLARDGRVEEAQELYEWFLPLLRFDTVPKFVQLIKLVQTVEGRGSERVRPPRLALTGEERTAALAVIETARRTRHQISVST
ncbi:MAG TPA: dihydrodipicolinate synthase family protein [Longimicrobiales bacterium]